MTPPPGLGFSADSAPSILLRFDPFHFQGECARDGMQRLLRWADWDIDGVRDDLRDYVVERLGRPNGVLILDDTGFVKKGVRSAGVRRQSRGPRGGWRTARSAPSWPTPPIAGTP